MRKRERDKLDNALYVGIGQRIRDARLRRDISQEQLAAAVGLNRSSVANLEVGRQRSQLHTLIHIARVLGVNYLRFLPKRNPRRTS